MKHLLKFIIILTFLTNCATLKCNRPSQLRQESQSVVIVRVDTTTADEITGAPTPAAWSGTGFSISSDDSGSDILTNKHVCAAKENGRYTLTDTQGHKTPAVYMRSDDGADVCLLHTALKIPPLKLAQSDAKRGDHVNTIGAPHGEYPYFTDGIISGYEWVDMQEEILPGMAFAVHFRAQALSAPIYPGNSGSPVFNDAGEVVGIIFAGRRDSEHMSVMVPVGLINQFLDTSENIKER